MTQGMPPANLATEVPHSIPAGALFEILLFQPDYSLDILLKSSEITLQEALNP